MPSKPLSFENRNGLRLSALLDLPDEASPRAVVLFAHCFTCGKDIKGAFHLSRALTDAGLAVLRFDFTGLGESQGSFGQTTFSSSVEDLQDAAEFLAHEIEPPQLLLGHSMGGAAALVAGGRIAAIRAVATIGAPAEPAHALRHFSDRHDDIRSRGEARVVIEGRPFTVGRQLLDDLGDTRLGEAIKRMEKPLLVMHAPLDQTVGIDHAGRIFAAARHPKSFISLDRADHLLSRPADARYAGTLIAAWVARYLGTNDRPAGDDR